MKKKGNKKTPILRQEVIDNPIPTSLFFVLKVMSFVLKLHHQYPQTNNYTSEMNKDVGMRLSMTSCLSIGVFLFPFFFMK